MSNSRVRLGRLGESVAVQELTRRGHRVVSRNWRCRIGEVDIVACYGERWTFFEVRTRRGRDFGVPEESLTGTKIERMVDVACMYLAEHGENVHEVDWGIGLVAVEMDRAGRLLRVDVYENILP